MDVSQIDANSRGSLTAVSNADGVSIVRLYADPVTHRLLTSAVATANLIVGTSTITSGTNGYALYDNNGVIGEKAFPSGMAIGASITSATQGSILFAGAAGVLAQDNSNLFWDATHHYLGIGTTSLSNLVTLSTALTGVSTNCALSIIDTSNSTNNDNLINAFTPNLQNGNENWINWGVAASSKNAASLGFYYAGAGSSSNRFDFATFGSATPQISFLASGNVGIGTITPSSLLTVAGDTASTTFNGLTITGSTGTFTLTNGKTLKVDKTLEFDGTDSTKMTFPSTSATIARTDAAQTFTGTQTFSQVVTTANTITVTSNAGTIPITSKINNFTNSSASAMTITMATASAVDGQLSMVRIYDATGATKGITWVNTENSLTIAPTTSNGSTTLPLTVGLQFNSATSLWRVIAVS